MIVKAQIVSHGNPLLPSELSKCTSKYPKTKQANSKPMNAHVLADLSSSPQSNEPNVVTALTRLHKDELARRVLDTFVAEFARVQKKRTSPSPYASPKAILHSERFQKRIRDRAQKQANLISFESNIIFETGRVVIPPALGMA